MSTIYDVAKYAKVSKSTVSRYLNHSTLVSDEVKSRIEKAVKQLNYHPSQIARTLSNKKSNLIALIIPYMSHHFFSKLTEEIENELFKRGYRLFTISAKNDKKLTEDYLNVFQSFYIDGIIICNHTLSPSSYLKYKVPLLSFERYLNHKIPCVSSDNYKGGELATNYLINHGCKKLGIISGVEFYQTKAKERIDAFIDICREKTIPYKELKVNLNDESFDIIEKNIQTFLIENPDINGIFATSDDFGICTIRVAKRLNINVPNELQVIGFDDIEMSRMIQPELTTIRQDIYQLAKEIVENLMKKIENHDDELPVQHVPIQLVKRKSTK